ncbi:SDR family oxidoreductase [Diaminobutyricibacter tongyongensis]|uniref:SDR family oxidoreductase n=1 Tax=Leifsonia tongyongensis TaxID=1268043 RepID=A0A6L9XWB3_9MICO|nr:SDR family oxidoreductase [Diaminobutyricibacter tongyongensis]NEN05298.1 SDR family oxidoreductase [Diaminobutyricibacter tongyongensis]
MSEFENLVALVTGGSSGIGAATARELLSRGASVAVLDRNPSSEPGVLFCEADITDVESVTAAITRVVEHFGRLDIVVNNAGIGAVGDVGANDDDEWRRVLDLNVVGTVRVTRAALPHLLRSPAAAIVNTCSIVARVGVPQRALYSASKGAIEALTLATAADFVGRVRVNAVLPGTADTPWVSRLLDGAEDAALARDQLTRRQPMGRLVTADEAAYAIAYLASPRAASTTGTLLAVDGGMGGLRVPEAAR